MAHRQAKFTPIDLRGLRGRDGFTDVPADAVWHPRITGALATLPAGATTLWGIPFRFRAATARGRWAWLGRGGAPSLRLRVDDTATSLVFAHFSSPSRASREPQSPDGRPSGVVAAPGEPLADYVLTYDDGTAARHTVRRRFEINDVTVAWGQLAFMARPHRATTMLDWRGPHPDGGWGQDQTTVMVPDYALAVADRAGGNAIGNYWLYALPNPHPDRRLTEVSIEAKHAGLIGIGAVTLFHGDGNPLAHRSTESILVEGPAHPLRRSDIGLDLGVVGRVAMVPRRDRPGRREDAAVRAGGDPAAPVSPYAGPDDSTVGWGAPSTTGDPSHPASGLVDVSAADAATISVLGSSVELADLRTHGHLRLPNGPTVTLLPAPDRWVDVEVVDAASGDPTACRVHVAAPDGRYLPPAGHRHEVNDRWFEDDGADLLLGGMPYAYVDGRFRILLPRGEIDIEVVKGFEYLPVRTRVEVGAGTDSIRLTLDRAFDSRRDGWATADTHVHFLSPDTARLEAAAEGIDVVNLLASQWGDLYTNVGDFTRRGDRDPAVDDGVIVRVGTENRNHMLGHLAALGLTDRLPTPLSTGGPEESAIGDAVWASLADWSDECRRQGGLVVIPHFPEPLSEVVADIILGKVDAVEIRDFTWGPKSQAVREWYRLLDCGFRVGAVGGTDKMSAGMPVGGVRTYAQVGPERSFERWADAVRAGRTVTTSGPMMDLSVDGYGLGSEVAVGAGGATLEIDATATCVQPLTAVEIVHNGRVVAQATADHDGSGGAGVHRIRLRERLHLDPGWIAARAWGPGTAWHEWPVRIAAHTSPIYVTGGRLVPRPADIAYLGHVIEGGLAWLDTLAPRADPEVHLRMRDVFLRAGRTLAAR